MTVKPWMEAALRARLGQFTPGPREFFTEVDYRDPVVMRTHGYHWIDLGYMEHEPNADPVRRGPLLYNIFITRTEGHATGWEEQMLQAGMFDARPRSRELIYILLAQRAARALGDLRMHANLATHRAIGGVHRGERPARLAEPQGESRALRAAPLPAAARLRDELRDREADRRPPPHDATQQLGDASRSASTWRPSTRRACSRPRWWNGN